MFRKGTTHKLKPSPSDITTTGLSNSVVGPQYHYLTTLDKEIYMCQPDSFHDKSGHVLKLHQAIYGLKQSGCSWYKKLMTVLFNDGFTQSHADDCVFYKKMDNQLSIIMIYVDNLGLFTSTKALCGATL